MPAPTALLQDDTDVAQALSDLGLPLDQPVVVLVGGAAGLEDGAAQRLIPALGALCEIADECGACIVDGGTDSGVMRLLGDVHSATGCRSPLVGVAVAALLGEQREDGAAPEPHHTHFVLVPGEQWGDETPWIARVAEALATDSPSVTVLVNGGDIALTDVRASVAAGRPVVVLAGSGRVSEELARALAGEAAGTEVEALAHSELVTAVSLEDLAAMKAAVRARLQ